MNAPRPRQGLLVVGTGNRLRGDDGVGPRLLDRLRRHFGPGFPGVETPLPDVSLAPLMADAGRVVIIDALARPHDAAYRVVELRPARGAAAPAGAVAHAFDWPAVLAVAAQVCGRAPQTRLVGITAHSFGISETLSPPCRANADEAFGFLVRYCGRQGVIGGREGRDAGED